MALLKEATVHGVVSWNGDQSHWNIAFSRSPNDWEEESVCRFFASLAEVKVLPEGTDEIIWPYDSTNSFTIKNFCTSFTAVGIALTSLSRLFGSLKSPQKRAFFL